MRLWIEQQWYRLGLWHVLLIPLSWVYQFLSKLRRIAYQYGILKSYKLPVPVTVVGNITAGGTGKTPLVIWIALALKQAGYAPAIISRGYGGSEQNICAVNIDGDPSVVGDEPILLAKHSHCPVWVGRDRVAVGQALLKAHPECNVIVSDDGLQHYRLQRDVEVAVVDSMRGFGNGYRLPAGSLRESTARLAEVDAVIKNGNIGLDLPINVATTFVMQLQTVQFYQLSQPQNRGDASDFVHKKIHAIAGIGNPERFFQTLRGLGLSFDRHVFADHHAFQAQDLQIADADIILMTEKDAVKCKPFANQSCWVLPVVAQLEQTFLPYLLARLNSK
ncbi:MAG TPA: tetraacyldisaccharide 4'-kinase [Methylophilaceae bacterium]|jgi:tetraacyldisaccharide 4'-kinase